jgi:flagellar protein FlaG
MLIQATDVSSALPSTAQAAEGIDASSPPEAQAQQPPVAPAAPAVQPPTTEELKHAAKQASEVVQKVATNLEFAVDKELDTVVVKLLDSDTHEVIRQVPSTEMLRIAKSLDQMQGLLLDDRA